MRATRSNYYKANSFLEAPTEIRTRVSGFKDLSDNHYTIGATNENISKT